MEAGWPWNQSQGLEVRETNQSASARTEPKTAFEFFHSGIHLLVLIFDLVAFSPQFFSFLCLPNLAVESSMLDLALTGKL